MGISINIANGQTLGEVNDISVHGAEGCGVYVLYLRIIVSVGKLNSNAIVSQLNCRMELTDTNIKIANGFTESRPHVRWTKYSTDNQLGFFFYLSGNQLDAIEKYRNSGDLRISICLSGDINYEDKVDSFFGKESIYIPKQQWLEALSAMKYQNTLLLEIPMPEKESQNENGLSELLKRAQNHILNGHYQESVALCRQAIELIEITQDDKSQAKSANKKYKEARADMSIQERMLFLREAIKNVTHLAAHNGDDFSRKQAQVILGITVSMLSSPEVGIPQIG